MLKIFTRLVLILSPAMNVYQFLDYNHRLFHLELRHKNEIQTLHNIIVKCDNVVKLLLNKPLE